MSLSLTEIIAGVAGLATVFGLFGTAMYFLGKTREKLGNIDKKVDKLETEFKGDIKDVQKAHTDISIKLHTYIAARREEEKLGRDKDE